jgi:hypothetical protein
MRIRNLLAMSFSLSLVDRTGVRRRMSGISSRLTAGQFTYIVAEAKIVGPELTWKDLELTFFAVPKSNLFLN